MHLRYLTRLRLVAFLAVLSILYCAWRFPSLQVSTRLEKAFHGVSTRIVVFGDSFSDTGANVERSSIGESLANRPVGSRPWVTTLCDEFVCDHIHNFAQSYPAGREAVSGGAVLDNGIYANTTSDRAIASKLLPDLKAQVQKWIAFEDKHLTPTQRRLDDILFTITFGPWDLLHYATLDSEIAQEAIGSSIYVLFQQLDIIADRSVKPPRIVIPLLWDVTFSPYFMSLSDNITLSEYGNQQRRTAFLIRFWNEAIRYMAGQWARGFLFLPDWNAWVAEQLRINQLQASGTTDASGAGKDVAAFSDVSTPCLHNTASKKPGALPAVGAGCDNPGEHLFWDDLHFSEKANRLLGRSAVDLLAANDTANAPLRASSVPADTNRATRRIDVHVGPGMPPGL
ncbi:hypothetical protein EJ06DRAFT_4609 [Trichodelitschia bisporula]|uniref:SGNH hydrolase n=1 Tax=Trichodelitschia bisporula TaxID=703511 RepID=A0A6G1IA54_9PEZI|nr:hypothetical protein EJ06DRAFT_4609 [Trichodelitschia bisporula]